MNQAEWLRRSATRAPEAPALLTGAAVVADYAGFADRAARLATTLRERLGVRPGDRVALFMGNRVDYLTVLYGAWWAGAAVVPINAKLHPKEAAWIVDNAGAALVFTDTAHAETLAPALAGLDPAPRAIDVAGHDFASLTMAEAMTAPQSRAPHDLAWLFYTSGTTGRPKGVMITNANLHAMAYAYLAGVDRVFPTDAACYAAPMSHGAGLYAIQHVLMGARHLVPESGGFEPPELLALGDAVGDLSLFAAPTMVTRLVAAAETAGEEGGGLRTVVYGGGPMYVADIARAVDVMGPRFVQIYGQGESPMTITVLSRDRVADRSHPNWRARLGSVGVAQSPVELRVADADGQALPAGETGEILVRGASVMAGYWRNEAATAMALRGGWLWTGDMGVLDADGYLTLKDRSKDVIISGGSNIYPREVEEALLLHPAVAEVSVVGRPSAEWGEEVVAFVVARPGTTVVPADLDRHCLDQIARFKRPKAYFALEALPKNNYGKVLKTELRARLEGTDGTGHR